MERTDFYGTPVWPNFVFVQSHESLLPDMRWKAAIQPVSFVVWVHPTIHLSCNSIYATIIGLYT
jgi:hypothetical protein